MTLYGLSIGAEGTLRLPDGHRRDHRRDRRIGRRRPDHRRLADGRSTTSGTPRSTARGKYFNAQNPQELAESIVSALADFTGQSGTGTAVGIAGAQFYGDQRVFGYRTSYEARLVG